eukprot:EG_transcript_10081
MGGRVSLQHVESNRFLDCSGNVPTAEPPKGTRDQWFVVRWEGQGVHISTDHYPHRRLCIQNGAVHLGREKCGQLFQAAYVQRGETQLVRFQCPDGFLAAPATGGPLTLVRHGDSPLTLWRVTSRDDADPRGGLRPAKAPEEPLALDRSTSGPGRPASGPSRPASGPAATVPQRTPSTAAEAAESVLDDASLAAIAWQVLQWLWATGLLLFWFVWRLVTGQLPVDTAKAGPERPVRGSSAESLPVDGSRLQMLRTHISWPGAPEKVFPHKPKEPGGHIDIPEGIILSETIHFKVLQGPVTNLRRRTTTFRKSLQVEQKDVVLGTFPASGQARAFTFPPDPVPTGWVVRGAYRCVVEFIDDAGPCCPPWEVHFSIVKAKHCGSSHPSSAAPG